MGALIRIEVLIGMGLSMVYMEGHLLTKTHSKGGTYSKEGASWKEGANSNHYGMSIIPASLLTGGGGRCGQAIRALDLYKCNS